MVLPGLMVILLCVLTLILVSFGVGSGIVYASKLRVLVEDLQQELVLEAPRLEALKASNEALWGQFSQTLWAGSSAASAVQRQFASIVRAPLSPETAQYLHEACTANDTVLQGLHQALSLIRSAGCTVVALAVHPQRKEDTLHCVVRSPGIPLGTLGGFIGLPNVPFSIQIHEERPADDASQNPPQNAIQPDRAEGSPEHLPKR